MLTPEEMQGIPDSLVSLFDDFDEWVIRDYSRHVSEAAKISSTTDWLMERSFEMGLTKRKLKEKVSELLGLSEEELEKVIYGTTDRLMLTEADRLKIAKDTLNGIRTNTDLGQYLESIRKQTNGAFRNITGTMGFTMNNGTRRFVGLPDAYIEACDLAQMQVSTGVLDYNTACRQAVRAVSGNGVSCLDYAIGYESGFALSVRSAVQMAVRTGTNQLCGHINEQIAMDIGTDLVEVTAHAGARPDHALWQGGIYSLSGKSIKYRSLKGATRYGEGDGLAGWNCRHMFFAYVEGAPKMYSKDRMAEINALDKKVIIWNGRKLSYYDATQKARAYERSILVSKRKLIGFDAQNDSEAFTAESIRLQRKKEIYRNFCNTAGLLERWERTQQNSYGHSIASKAVWAARKAA